MLKKPPNGDTSGDLVAGEGCYVSATLNSRRFYGVLIDQASLKAGSLLHFEEEASGLELNRRMNALHTQRSAIMNGDHKQPAAEDAEDESDRKRPRLADTADSSATNLAPLLSHSQRQVQKFRFVKAEQPSHDYRELLATFADTAAAAEDDADKAKRIETACEAGGDFVGDYYYQFEPLGKRLKAAKAEANDSLAEMRMSLAFQAFLRKTGLPQWFPLSNLETDQQKVLNLLNMKKDNKGNVLWNVEAAVGQDRIAGAQSSLIPMEPRAAYRVCVVGGGIAGLSAALEIFRRCEREGLEIEVVLLEGRSRLGGRLWTDRDTFRCADGSTEFPVDLGASWIHGIDLNPLATLAREAGVDFVRSNEDVKMYKAGMEEVDKDKDTHAGELFDKLLDIAVRFKGSECRRIGHRVTDPSLAVQAETSWSSEDVGQSALGHNQAAVRWYASVLGSEKEKGASPLATDVPGHRRSHDVSVDRAVGCAIAKQERVKFEKLSEEERRMLFWNMKNVEYALGANMSDLSMKFWDIDERHAFEGDHVILRQGYSTVVDHLLQQLKQRGERFQCHLNAPVGKLEYARRTSTMTHRLGFNRNLVELSDTCCVSSRDNTLSVKCDFVVCAVPLGVLKAAVAETTEMALPRRTIEFDPELPFLKRDAIQTVGFGLLDKVYLSFPTAFWRGGENGLDESQTQFGNASGVHPHHYMFFDIGKVLGRPYDQPAVLMSLVSGKEAVRCEWLTPNELVGQTMETLRVIFSEVTVPDPIAYRTTRWGEDEFSRGSYTFLPPGATDQDFQSLQSPVNENGDSLLLEGLETMRLFFAGEHTTALHPSMAHGAMLSGIRAAGEVFSAISLDVQVDESFDRMIPMAMFRHMNPTASLECSFCHVSGSRSYEGPLLAFKRGSRQVLVHNCCAEHSPEVEVTEGLWRNVLKAVNRSAALDCLACGKNGASIGCNDEDCYKCYHFQCAEQTGWSFQHDGKEFYCKDHRPTDRALAGPPTHALFGGTTGGNAGSGNFLHALFEKGGEEPTPDPVGSLSAAFADETASRPDQKVYPDISNLASGLEAVGVTESRLVRVTRRSINDYWDIEFMLKPHGDHCVLSIISAPPGDPFFQLKEGDIVNTINGQRVGSGELDSLEKIVARLAQEVDVMMEVQRAGPPETISIDDEEYDDASY